MRKSLLCPCAKQYGTCAFGDKCIYKGFPLHYCFYFFKNGKCRHGDKCRLIHLQKFKGRVLHIYSNTMIVADNQTKAVKMNIKHWETSLLPKLNDIVTVEFSLCRVNTTKTTTPKHYYKLVSCKSEYADSFDNTVVRRSGVIIVDEDDNILLLQKRTSNAELGFCFVMDDFCASKIDYSTLIQTFTDVVPEFCIRDLEWYEKFSTHWKDEIYKVFLKIHHQKKGYWESKIVKNEQNWMEEVMKQAKTEKENALHDKSHLWWEFPKGEQNCIEESWKDCAFRELAEEAMSLEDEIVEEEDENFFHTLVTHLSEQPTAYCDLPDIVYHPKEDDFKRVRYFICRIGKEDKEKYEDCMKKRKTAQKLFSKEFEDWKWFSKEETIRMHLPQKFFAKVWEQLSKQGFTKGG